jgi:O-antigen/teichoic acid export membrane protein
LTLGGIAGTVISSLDRIVAAQVISLESVTMLTLSSRLYSLAGGILAQITNTARPGLAQLVGQRDLSGLMRTYRHLFALSSGGAIVAGLTLAAMNACFLSRWVGSQYYGGLSLDMALALNLVVHLWVLPNRALLWASLDVRAPVISRLIEGALNLILSVLLARHFGLFGVAIATALAGLLTTCWYLPLLTARLLRRNYLRFMWEDAAPLLLVASLMLPIAWWARSLGLQVGGFVGAALAGAITASAGGLLLYLLACDRFLRQRVRSAFVQAWTMVRGVLSPARARR